MWQSCPNFLGSLPDSHFPSVPDSVLKQTFLCILQFSPIRIYLICFDSLPLPGSGSVLPSIWFRGSMHFCKKRLVKSEWSLSLKVTFLLVLGPISLHCKNCIFLTFVVLIWLPGPLPMPIPGHCKPSHQARPRLTLSRDIYRTASIQSLTTQWGPTPQGLPCVCSCIRGFDKNNILIFKTYWEQAP